ncbi:hypothetical protein EDD11_002384 [Mortierella claussenii]|nr:hypothetical protein EDD11_002384 [Mortierella claussenii]
MMKHSKPRAVQASSQPKAPPLDMSSVATKAPSETPQSNPPSRIFGLQDAPCYYPTTEEFMEPLKFIESIRPEAEKAGICKIIPPDGWKPSFALDTEVFRFKTRIQKLNSMEGETRTNLNYLEQLYKFHRQQGHPVLKIPQLDKRPIDLFRLRKEVASRGGYQKVTSGKKWAEIGRGLDYTRKQCTSLSNALKSAYLKVILPYDIYLSKQGKLAPESQPQDLKRELSSELAGNGFLESSQELTPTNTISMPETRKSKRIKKDPVSYADSQPSSPSSSERMSSEPPSVRREHLGEEPDVCEICRTENDLDKMLICDGCELGYHTYCLTPPLQQIPKTDWYCAKCLVAGDDFGFEEGEEYSLSSFQKKCNDFKKSWFEKSGFKDGRVPEDTVEREFWRLVENAYETAEVEYGADLHSTEHGSGFPSLERHPNDKYSAHPANLNNIPVLPESLFCHIKTDISGMMVPWLYVGMCFSTFCWHNEDHYTYSINYMHWGETKTWYGVPALDALKFEDTMKKAVPELFESQPDLLFQLVTMLSPERLVANNVKVVALDQRPGQFVVTFPQAFHAGFNHGFNFAEAVNFAPPDWCPFGLECVKRYKEHRKQPVFSHDELILTTALNDTSIATAHWLQDEMRSLLERELADRQRVLEQMPKIKVILEEVDRSEEEAQCLHCNSYIYISQVGCRCTTKVACHDHVAELCKCDASDRFLRLRYSEEQLKDIIQRVVDNAAIPDAWIAKYTKTMMETRVPSLKLLRSLLAEADRIPFPITEAGRLRRFVAVANEWVESATKALVRKHHQGRRLAERAQGLPGKRLEDLQEMLHQVERLRFDCPEIKQLQESIEMMQDFQTDARNALCNPERDLAECRELYESGISMNIAMKEIDELEAIVTDLAWADKVSAKGILQEDFLLICSLVEDAEKSGVSSSNPLLKELVRKQEAGLAWEERARRVLNQNPVDLDELQAVIEAGKDFPVPGNVLSKAENLHSKAIEWQRTVEHLIIKSKEPKYEDRPFVSELKRALRAVDSIPVTIQDREMFEQESRKFDKWIARCQDLLLPPGAKKFVGLELEEALEDMKQNVEACTIEEKIPVSVLSFKVAKTVDSMAGSAGNTIPGPAGHENSSALNSGTAKAPLAETEVKDDMNGMTKARAMTMDVESIVPSEGSSGLEAASGDYEHDDQIYCLCRTSESGMMVECDECHEWYHGPCVRVTKREASTKSNYICPVCNLSLVIKRDKPRPMLDQLVKSSQDAQELRFFTPEVPLLDSIVATAVAFRERLIRFLKRDSITDKDIPEVKAYLRKIEGLDIELREEREALRTHVLRLCPSSMPVPGVMLSTYPTAPPLVTIAASCLCNQHVSGGAGQPPQVPVQPQRSEAGVMIQCGLCHEWHHIGCVGLDLEQVHKLSRYICPVCSVVRKKLYAHGPVQYTAEVQVRATLRNQANKEAMDAKKKKRKPSKDGIDPATGAAIGVTALGTEEKKKRAYKKRDPTKTGEKTPTKRRKSSAGQSTLPANLNAVGSHANTSSTTLPSFSEGFLLPPDRHSTHSSRQTHTHPHSQHHPRVGSSHTLPVYPVAHTVPALAESGPVHYQSSTSPPQHRYAPPPSLNGSYRSYAPPPRDHGEHVQLSPIQGHPPPQPLSRGSAPSTSHSQLHSHPYSHSQSHPVSPPSHERPGAPAYGNQPFGPIQQGHYPPPPLGHHHQHYSHRSLDERRPELPPHSLRDDPYQDRAHYGHRHPSASPPVPANARPYAGYGNGHGQVKTGSPVLSLTKNHHPVVSHGHGSRVISGATVGIGNGEGGRGHVPPPKSGFSHLETGSGGETETDEDELAADVAAYAAI